MLENIFSALWRCLISTLTEFWCMQSANAVSPLELRPGCLNGAANEPFPNLSV